MASISYTAKEIAYVAQDTSDNWQYGVAYQGQAAGGTGSRVGVFNFSDLRTEIDWQYQTINKITFTISFNDDGVNNMKNISMYYGNKSTISGTGSSIISSSLGIISTQQPVNGTTQTIICDSTTNSTIYTNFKSFLYSGVGTIFGIKNNETATTSSDSSNFLGIISITVVIEYEGGSGLTVTSNIVHGTKVVSATITPISIGGTVTHTIQWSIGEDASDVISLNSGTTTSSYTIPTSWIDKMTGLTTNAKCQLWTYLNGNLISSRIVDFEFNLPGGYYPDYQFDRYSTNPANSYFYFQYYSAIRCQVYDMVPKGGATISQVEIKTVDGYYYSTQDNVPSSIDVTTPILQKAYGSGQYWIMFKVTDSRGASTIVTRSFSVAGSVKPMIGAAFNVKRTTNYSGNPVYSESGFYMTLSLSVNYLKPGNDSNPDNYPFSNVNINANCYIDYGIIGNTLSRKYITISSADIAEGSHYIMYTDWFFESTVFNVNKNYEFNAYIETTAGIHTRRKIMNSPNYVPVHISGTGYGVSFGTYSTATDFSPKIESEWPIYANGGIYGVTNYTSGEILTGGKWTNNTPIYRYIWTDSINADGNILQLFNLPRTPVNIVDLRGTMTESDTGTIYQLPGSVYSYFIVNGSSVKLYTGSQLTGKTLYVTVIIEYTSTSI